MKESICQSNAKRIPLEEQVEQIREVVIAAREVAEKIAALQEEVERIEVQWDLEYRQTYYELCQLFPGDKMTVEAFFKGKMKKYRKPKDEPVPSAPEKEESV